MGFVSPSAPASVTSRYDILTTLGSGGMGIVYKARDRETGGVVALKVLHPEIASRPELIERFKIELLLARKITHKNVCRVYDLNRFDNVAAISMEYVEAQSMRALLDRPEGVSVRYGLNIVHQIISGLAEAHVQGVIHRDLKPENILVARDGTVKVMDFGIARSVDTGATLTGTITGTPAYMSPEQAEGKTADARSDIYSLGLVMYEMFCGQRAFTADTPFALALKQIQEAPAMPTDIEPHLPALLNRVILKCIEKNPAKRYQSVAELDTALTAKEDPTPAIAMREVAEPPLPLQLSRWQRSDWLLLPLAIAGLLVFFPSFHRTSLAPRSQVSFDRSVLRRIAEEYAQRLAAPIGQASEIRVDSALEQFEYMSSYVGAPAARELTNSPVPFWKWHVEWDTGTFLDVDSRGSLQRFERSFNGPIAKLPADETKPLAEKAVHDFLGGDPSVMTLETAGDDSWGRHTATKFTWSERNYGGLRRQYVVRMVGREIASLESNYSLPPRYPTPDFAWQLLPWLALNLVLLVVGLFQRHRVNLYSRWRIVAIALGSIEIGLAAMPIVPVVSSAIYLAVFLGLSCSLFMFFVFIPAELAVRQAGPSRMSTIVRLFDRRLSLEPCGMSVLRGTLAGLALLGIDAFLVWVGTSELGMRLDGYFLALQGRMVLQSRWPSAVVVLWNLLQVIMLTFSVALLTSFLTRVMRSRWLAIFLAAALAAAMLPGPVLSLGAVEPYPSKVLVLLFDCLVLAWTFTRYDVLTLSAAVFTSAFISQNYSLLVMFEPIGPSEQWFAFAVWGLLVAAAAAVAFKTSLMAAYHRAAAAIQ